jgi:hypothetical protein
MKKTILISALFAAIFSVGAAHADTILVDDFNSPSTSIMISDGTANGLAVTSTSATSPDSLASSRLLSVDLTQKNTRSASISAEVGGGVPDGYLNFSVSTGDNGIGRLVWTIPALTLPSGDNTFSFSILASALGTIANVASPNNIAFSFTGGTAGSNFTLDKNISAVSFTNPGTLISLALSNAESAFLSGGGQLELAFTGGQGWNLALDRFAIDSEAPANVPVPGSIALFGIALAAMRLVGKKSFANKS